MPPRIPLPSTIPSKINGSLVPTAPTLNTTHIAPNGSAPNLVRSWSGILGRGSGGMGVNELPSCMIAVFGEDGWLEGTLNHFGPIWREQISLYDTGVEFTPLSQPLH